MTYPKILEALRDSRRTYIFIEEFINCNEEAKYFSTFAKIDTDTSKDDIVLWFPKEQNGVFLKDFVMAHPLAIYHGVIPWDQNVPEDRWDEVAGYCENDVEATEATWNDLGIHHQELGIPWDQIV